MYFGGRTMLSEYIEEVLSLPVHSYQVVDTVPNGSISDPSAPIKLLKGLPTVVLSTRRLNVNDSTGIVEKKITDACTDAVVLRTAPLAGTLKHFEFSAANYGTIASCHDPNGVAWLDERDLVAVISAVLDSPNRSFGRAFDITGPNQVSMSGLAEHYSRMFDREIGFRRVDPDEMCSVLQMSGLDARFASWLVRHQEESSDPQLSPTTPTAQTMLQRQLFRPLEEVSS